MPFFESQGRRLFYRAQGQGSLLLILPGNTAASIHHQGELDYFGQRWRAVSFDYWGTGRSARCADWPVDWYQQCADDAAALVDHLGSGGCSAVGTSGGAIVALWLAIRHPGLVTAVIADSGASHFTPAWRAQMLAERAQRAPGQIEFWQAAHGDDWEQVVTADTDMLLRLGSTDLFAGRLSEVTCPVMLTASLADSMVPDVNRQPLEMVRQIGNGRLYVATRGEHPLMWTNPDEFRSVSSWFLAQHLPSLS